MKRINSLYLFLIVAFLGVWIGWVYSLGSHVLADPERAQLELLADVLHGPEGGSVLDSLARMEAHPMATPAPYPPEMPQLWYCVVTFQPSESQIVQGKGVEWIELGDGLAAGLYSAGKHQAVDLMQLITYLMSEEWTQLAAPSGARVVVHAPHG